MSDDPNNTILEALRLRERTLELEAVDVRGRIAEVRDLICKLENGPQRNKRGRPPGPRAVFTPRRVTPSDPPLHVAGAAHQPAPPDDDELPLQSDAPGA